MARKAREISQTGIYHILIRANVNLDLFMDDEDTTFYVNILQDLIQKGYARIFAYSLHPTHIHLLLQEPHSSQSAAIHSSFLTPNSSLENHSSLLTPNSSLENHSSLLTPNSSLENHSSLLTPHSSLSEAPHSSFLTPNSSLENHSSLLTPNSSLSSIAKRLASTYSYYYNVKYDHYGPIYQDRFKSQPVETRDFFLRVLNFIMAQPVPSKFIINPTIPHFPPSQPSAPPNSSLLIPPSSLENHSTLLIPPSSLENHSSLLSPNSSLTTAPLSGDASSDLLTPPSSLENHSSLLIPNSSLSAAPPSSLSEAILDYTPRPRRITDSRLIAYLQQHHAFTDKGEFLQRPTEDQNRIIADCKQQGGSVRQLVRLTGIPFQQVFRAK